MLDAQRQFREEPETEPRRGFSALVWKLFKRETVEQTPELCNVDFTSAWWKSYVKSVEDLFLHGTPTEIREDFQG